MPLLVMIIIEKAIPRPSVHANRFGFAETQSGRGGSSWRRAITPIGLGGDRASAGEELDEEQRRAACSGMYCASK